jgi:MASE1 protein
MPGSLAAGARTLGIIAALALVYAGVGRVGLSFAVVHPGVSPLWPPTGLALAALLGFGDRVWPGILIGAFAVNLPVTHSVGWALAIAVGNTLGSSPPSSSGASLMAPAPSCKRATSWCLLSWRAWPARW